MALAYSAGTGIYDHPQGAVWLASPYPYVRLALYERLDVWGPFGYGLLGELRLSDTDVASETNLAMVMGGFGARATLLAVAETRRLVLVAKADGLVLRDELRRDG